MSYLNVSDQTAYQTPGQQVFEYTETIQNGETSEYIIPTDQAGKIRYWSVGLVTSGTARVEYSLSPRAAIKSGSAVWRSWDAGNVTENTDDIIGPVNAVRVVSITGQAIIEVVAV